MLETSYANKIKHLAFIMDGNRRWAKARNLPVIAGHKEGVEALKKVTKFCLDHGIANLTVYAFSTENWKRNSKELEFLFKLLSEVALRELADLRSLGVKVNFLGDISRFDNFNIQENLQNLADETSSNIKLNLNLALNYGSIQELTNALNKIKLNSSKSEIENLSEEELSNKLYTAAIPDPEILVRTGGEERLSNFLLWQIAKSNLVFTETLWPDFADAELTTIIENYLESSNLLEVASA